MLLFKTNIDQTSTDFFSRLQAFVQGVKSTSSKLVDTSGQAFTEKKINYNACCHRMGS